MNNMNNFIDWLDKENYRIIKYLNDHEFEEYSKEDIIEAHKVFYEDLFEKRRKEELLKGMLLCRCYCCFPILKDRCRDNKIQCPYCGKRHAVSE